MVRLRFIDPSPKDAFLRRVSAPFGSQLQPATTREAEFAVCDQSIYQQMRRWLEAGVFEEMVHDLRLLLRLSEGRASEPTAAILDSRTLQSTPESGSRGGYDGAKRKKGSKVHAAVDTLGHLLALFVSPANEQERAWVGELAEAVQEEATGESVELAYVDQGYS